MTIQMKLACTRCHRDDVIDLNELSEATALENLQKKKAEVLTKLQDFVKSLPQDALPDFFAVLGDKTMVHSYLCDPKDEGKRSCAKRVGELLDGVAELPKERAPRKKKGEAAAPTTEAAPPPAPAETTAAPAAAPK